MYVDSSQMQGHEFSYATSSHYFPLIQNRSQHHKYMTPKFIYLLDIDGHSTIRLVLAWLHLQLPLLLWGREVQ